MTIVEFLRSRLNEDEAYAKLLLEHEERDGLEGRITIRRWLPKFPGKPHDDPCSFPQTPGRILAEAQAKRAILSHEIEMNKTLGIDGESYPMRAMAQIYRSHRDYDSAWLDLDVSH